MINTKKIRYFKGVANGTIDAPLLEVIPSISLFNGDYDVEKFSECHYSLRGIFDRHYWASIPYALEQEARLGSAILKYSSSYKNLTLWCMNMAEATLARSLSRLGDGRIISLANTKNIMNKNSFYAHGIPKNAYLKILSDAEIIEQFNNIVPIECINGFDIIIEDTSFQMKSSNRLAQINNVKKVLKKNGIFIMTEKFLGDEYVYWENKKDLCFKSRFFSKDSIKNKKNKILKKMEDYQVSLEILTYAASKSFTCGVIFWNSGNFYSIAVCDDENTLTNFIGNMIAPCIPKEFSRGIILQPIFGINKKQLYYRNINSPR